MLSAEQNEILRRAYSPQLETLLEDKIREELNILPSIGLDKVQVHQGRTLVMQEFLAELRHAAGITANRTTKPKL